MKTQVVEDTMAYIIAMNNNAVSLMMRGSRRKAARILFEALQTSKKMQQQHTRSGTAKVRLVQRSIYNNSSRLSNQSFSQINHENVFKSVIETVDFSRIVPSDGNNFALFNHAFIFNEELSREQIFQLILKAPGLLNIILLYNTALCHHQEGVARGNSSSLANALRTYKVLASIIIQTKTKSAERRDLLIPMLAIWNNMGHIHSSFFRFKESQKCVKCVGKLLAIANGSNFYGDELRLFHKHAVIPPEVFFATAPAA